MKRNLFQLLIILIITISCKKETANNSNDDFPPLGTLKLFSNVVILNNSSNLAITQATVNSLTINSTSQIDSLIIGNIIIGAPTSFFPNGFLRKIISINTSGTSKIIQTEPTTLDFVIEECNIKEDITFQDWTRRQTSSSISQSLNCVLYDRDGNNTTDNDRIDIVGSVELVPSAILELKRIKGRSITFDYAKIGYKQTFTKSVIFNADLASLSFDTSITLATFKTPTPLLIAGLIYVTPSIKLSVGAEGEISANMTFGADDVSEFTIYKEYYDNSFKPLKYNKSASPSNVNFDLTGKALLEVYLKTKLELKFYEFIGVNASCKTYLNGSVEYSTSTPNQIDYCLKAGLKGGVGVELNAFGLQLAEAETEAKFWEEKLPKIGSFDPCSSLFLQLPTNGLVAHYNFNGNTNDISGNGNNGSVVGTSNYSGTDRKNNVNSSFTFDGNTYISIPDAISLDMGTNELSISMWVKINTPNSVGYRLIDKATPNSPNSGYSFDSYSGTQGTGMRLTAIGSNVTLPYPSFSYTLNTWHHLVVSFKAGESRFYLDGAYVGGSYHNGTNTIKNMSLPLIIGASNNSYSFKYKGQMDDIRLFNREITESEIVALYNE